MGSQASQSLDLRWRRLYEAAVLEVDLKILPRRVRVAKKAIHSHIVKLHKVDEAGDIWALMDALNVLDDLLKMNQADLPTQDSPKCAEEHGKPLTGVSAVSLANFRFRSFCPSA